MSFEQLLEELNALEKGGETLKKAHGPECDEEEDKEDDIDGDKDADEDGEKAGDYEDEMLGKSMTLEIDGEQVQAYDGEALIKAMVGTNKRIAKTEEQVSAVLAKAISVVKGRDEVIKQQGKLIKSLQDDVAAMGEQGRGRKTVLRVLDRKDDLQKSQGIPVSDFRAMLKSAFAGGKISGGEAVQAENLLNSGAQVPESIVRKVMDSL